MTTQIQPHFAPSLEHLVTINLLLHRNSTHHGSTRSPEGQALLELTDTIAETCRKKQLSQLPGLDTSCTEELWRTLAMGRMHRSQEPREEVPKAALDSRLVRYVSFCIKNSKPLTQNYWPLGKAWCFWLDRWFVNLWFLIFFHFHTTITGARRGWKIQGQKYL